MDFSIICRFCMAVDGPMMNIFKDIGLKAKANALLPNLKLFNDGLPNHVCKHCIYQLNAAYKFKRKCEHTDIILRQHLETAPPASTSTDNSITVHEEIQIDSDEDDDIGSIVEPLVVLSSNVNLEDQDPLDLGHEEKQSLYDADSSDAHTNSTETAAFCSLNKSLENNRSTAFTSSIHESDVVCVNLEDSNGGFPDSHEHGSVTIECSNVDLINSDGTQINCSAEHISLPEHFLNEGCEKLQQNNIERYRCPVCDVPFVSRYRMEVHLAKHDGETPYTCPLCKKGFGREGGLKAHLKLHTGERPHVCTICNKAFSLKGNLKVHLRLHTGEKPFQCMTCMKAFTQKISLTKHLSVHKVIL